MKIRSLALNQFKKFDSPMSLDGIADGLNVVVGPNEWGKSTLLDALRAALFEKYSSKAQSIMALQNARNQAAPVVDLAFEVDDGIYRIKKRFVKKPYAQLSCPDGRKLEGDAAEDALRELLGFDEPGKSGAKPETLGMWNVLWVLQGQSFGALDLPDSARSNMHSALESEVGKVLGGKRGRALPQAVEKQLSELVTSTGRPRGLYKEFIDEIVTLEPELEGLQARRKELSQTLEDLETAQDSLERLSSGDRDKTDSEELEAARKRHGQLAELESRIQAAATEAELKKRNLAQAEQALDERHRLKEQVKSEQGGVEEAQKSFDEVRQSEKDIRTKLDGLRRDVRDAQSAVTKADQDVSLKRRILEAVQRDIRIRELQARYEKAHKAELRQRSAQQRAMAILVTDDNIDDMRSAAKDVESARARLAAAATVISFDIPPERLSEITVNDDPLSPDQASVQAIEPTTIAIPEFGQITVEPAIKDRDKLLGLQRKAAAALTDALETGGVKSLDAAEEQYTKRQKLLQEVDLARQEAELHAPASDDYGAGAEALADYIEGLRTILKREMDELVFEKLPAGQEESEAALREAQTLADDAREALATAQAALEGPQEELGRIQADVGGVEARYEDAKKRLDKLKNDLGTAEGRVSNEDLHKAIKAAEKALADQQKAVADLEAQREGETLPQLEARISRLEKALEDRRDKRSKLKEQIAGHRSRIEALEGAGLDEAIQQKARELELGQEQRERFEREVHVLSLLLTTLRTAESDAKERYLSPVLKRVRPYLQLLFPGAEITIDENLHIVGVVRDGGYEESFHHLSMGTQEQIAVLVRLAFAEMLVEQGYPATVVLDDALAFSDDQRMKRMFDILNMVAHKVQVIILTCREELFEGVGGHHLSLQSGDAEELVSA
jgi:DNA repair exonuclease SbcCD ATPase subunit